MSLLSWVEPAHPSKLWANLLPDSAIAYIPRHSRPRTPPNCNAANSASDTVRLPDRCLAVSRISGRACRHHCSVDKLHPHDPDTVFSPLDERYDNITHIACRETPVASYQRNQPITRGCHIVHFEGKLDSAGLYDLLHCRTTLNFIVASIQFKGKREQLFNIQV